ncbi:MAG: N-acetylmuramoyl-L-alanine amidase family protein, partial [Lachnospiraceae bacterium]|nr:N-acetylmuramoyl-L-alanine amidase family protein [Lachnospiraceae bacterium]
MKKSHLLMLLVASMLILGGCVFNSLTVFAEEASREVKIGDEVWIWEGDKLWPQYQDYIIDPPLPPNVEDPDCVIQENGVDYLYRSGDGYLYRIKDNWGHTSGRYTGLLYGDEEGRVVKNQWRYLNKPVQIAGGAFYNVEKGSEKAWYYFDENGHLDDDNTLWTSGKWLYWQGHWYFLAGADGMRTGWTQVSNEWYYMNESGEMQTGWIKYRGYWYYLNEDGKMQIGWQNINGKWYYFDTDGSIRLGWLKDKDKWYYLSTDINDCSMTTGWEKIDGKWYYFDENGAM